MSYAIFLLNNNKATIDANVYEKITFTLGTDTLQINFHQKSGDVYHLQFVMGSSRSYAAVLYNDSYDAIWKIPRN